MSRSLGKWSITHIFFFFFALASLRGRVLQISENGHDFLAQAGRLVMTGAWHDVGWCPNDSAVEGDVKGLSCLVHFTSRHNAITWWDIFVFNFETYHWIVAFSYFFQASRPKGGDKIGQNHAIKDHIFLSFPVSNWKPCGPIVWFAHKVKKKPKA